VNDDGLADMMVGAAYSDLAGTRAGASYFYLGASSGIASTPTQVITASDADPGDAFGRCGGAGDVNGDGYDDVTLLGPYTDDAGSASGSVYVYQGSSSGLDTTSELIITARDAAAGAVFGHATSGRGDIDADGYDDVVVSAPFDSGAAPKAGAVYVYLGSSAGVDASSEMKITASDAAALDSFGAAIFGPSDIDADGFGDLAVGAEGDSDGAGYGTGAVYIYMGAPGGVDTTTEAELLASDGAAGDGFAYVTGGDFDADGFVDLFVGARGDDDLGSHAGAGYVVFGSESGIDAATEVKLTASDGAAGDGLGYGMAAGDFDGDGFDDVAVGAFADDSYAGSVYIFEGSCRDLDGDGSCLPGDCDDDDATVNPAATETCDAVDNDCDGTTDEDDAADASTWYGDADADTHGDPAASTVSCSAPAGHVADNTDCDDTNASVNPSASELCNGLDDDCDGTTDEDDAADAPTWYADADADTFGDPLSSTVACEAPAAHVADDTDCDDTSAAVNPAAAELCNGLDDDCDAATEEDCGDGEAAAGGCSGCASTGAAPALASLAAVLALARRHR
jgi:hypothetical protein